MLDRVILPPLIGACVLFVAADALPDLLGVVVAVVAAMVVAAHSARL
jgi:hypothetical protein